MKFLFFVFTLSLAAASHSLAGTTLTGLDKAPDRYPRTFSDITMDDLCVQDGKAYSSLDEKTLKSIRMKLRTDVDSMKMAHSGYSEIAKDAKRTFWTSAGIAGASTLSLNVLLCKGVCGPAGALPAMITPLAGYTVHDILKGMDDDFKFQRKHPENKQCLSTERFLLAIRQKMSEVQDTYFEDGLKGRVKNSLSLGLMQALGGHYLSYYSALAARVAEVELRLAEAAPFDESLNTRARLLYTLNDGVCSGKKIYYSLVFRTEAMKSAFTDVANQLQDHGASFLYDRLAITPRSERTLRIAYGQAGDIACARKVLDMLKLEMGVEAVFEGMNIQFYKSVYTHIDGKKEVKTEGPGGEVLVNLRE